MLLRQKVVLITGGASGIGYECVKSYVREGARVCIIDRSRELLANVSAEIGSDHLCLFGDVSADREVEETINQALRHFGQLDVIHNNAGISFPSRPLHETTPEEWSALMNVNLRSIYLTTRFGIEPLRKTKGCILNTSSLVGEIGQENHAAYSATKGAINALTKSMAIDYAKYGIRVNAVCPAGVWTPLLREWIAEQEEKSQIARYLDQIHVLGYCPNGDVVADACTFLISDMARFITGCLLPVSGGAELGYRVNITDQ